MRVRGIVSIEYEIEGGFLEAAEEEAKLMRAVSKIINGNRLVCYHEFRIRSLNS